MDRPVPTTSCARRKIKTTYKMVVFCNFVSFAYVDNMESGVDGSGDAQKQAATAVRPGSHQALGAGGHENGLAGGLLPFVSIFNLF